MSQHLSFFASNNALWASQTINEGSRGVLCYVNSLKCLGSALNCHGRAVGSDKNKSKTMKVVSALVLGSLAGLDHLTKTDIVKSLARTLYTGIV